MSLRGPAAFLAACLLASPAIADMRPAGVSSPAMREALSSVVAVLPVWPRGQVRVEEPEGSGVVLGDGTIIATADHVLGRAGQVFIRSGGIVQGAEILARDPATDIALLRIADPLKAADIAETAGVAETACAAGNAFGLGMSVTCGVISAVNVTGAGFNRIEDFIQTDASVNPGMSGGALFDGEGRLVGMLSAIFTKQSDASIGVNFAVSAALLARVVADLSDNGRIDRPRAGLVLAPHPPPGKAGRTGAQVRSVMPGSPEEQAGILPGDVILRAGPLRTARAGAYPAAIALLEPGEPLTVTLLREGAERTVRVTHQRHRKTEGD